VSLAVKRACVTGGAGFIGSKLVRSLLDRGIDVRVLDDLSVGRRENVPDGAELIVGDILEREQVLQAVDGVDVVFHLAARVAIRSSFDYVVEDTRVNVCGTASVMDAARRAGSVKKVVFTSSMAVYADSPKPDHLAESYETRPISPYGVSKLAAESLVHLMCGEAGIDSVVVRLFNTYGPGQTVSPYVGVVTIFADLLRRGESPTIFGDGEQCRDFTHVEDVVAGLLNAMDARASGESFNLGAGEAISVNQVFEAVRDALGSDLPARYEPAAKGEVRNSVADITRAAQVIGYAPQHRFETSIKQVLADMAKVS
jgi:UDP-glucose 4-epimerase